MNIKNYLCKLSSLIVLLSCIAKINSTCTVELEKCTSTVNPLLKDISYMFPSSKEEVLRMCSIWSNIVDCVRHFAKKCFNSKRKHTFNLAVEGSIGTVHSICVSDDVQKQYLENAVCLRDVSIRSCKLYFNQLVDIVANPKAQDDHICCAYAKFRKCVDVPLAAQCGNIVKNLMDHSLTFLIQKCDIPDSSLSAYDNCQLPISLGMATINSGSMKQNRKLDDHTNQFETNGGFYPINPQLISPYLIKKQQENYQATNDEIENNDSTSTLMNSKDLKSQDKTAMVDNEFNLNQANKFSRQDDEFETDKHRDYSTESPAYMMSHFSPQELSNSHSLIYNYYLLNLPVLISLLIFVYF